MSGAAWRDMDWAWARAWARAGECVVPAAILLAGGAMDVLCDRRPAHLPWWMPSVFSWPVYGGCMLALWLYCRGWRRLRRQGMISGIGPGRAPVFFLLGVGAIYAVLQTHFLYAAQHLFTFNRVQHLAMHHLGPFLIALSDPGRVLRHGAPRRLRAALGRPAIRVAIRVVMRRVQHPMPACLLFFGLVWLWLIPPVHVRAMLDPTLFAVMNDGMVIDGLLFWFLILDPRPGGGGGILSQPARLFLVTAVQLPQIAAGAAIAFAGRDIYPYYDICGRLVPGIDAGLDQQIGGSIVCYGGGMMSALAALILFGRLWRDDTPAATVPGVA